MQITMGNTRGISSYRSLATCARLVKRGGECEGIVIQCITLNGQPTQLEPLAYS